MEGKYIQVTVNVKLQEYLDFIKLVNKKWFYGYSGFVIALIIVDIIVKNVSGLIYIPIILGGYEFIRRVRLKKHFESNKLAQKEEIFNFTEKGIEIIKVDGSGNSNIKWDELYGVKLCKMGHMIPSASYNMTTGSTGGDGAHNNMPPYIVLNYCIKQRVLNHVTEQVRLFS